MPRVLHIDLETYSEADLGACGLYRYVDSDSFQILLFAYAFDGGPVTVLDLFHSSLPDELRQMIQDPNIIKVAHNAAFERTCLSKYLGVQLQPSQWHCTMVHAQMLGLPASLKDVGAALGLGEDKKKLATGTRLISYFCKPCRPTKANGGRTRNLPEDDPEKWGLFIEYNRRDVEAEQEIYRRLMAFPIPAEEQEMYGIDQRINDYGIRIDMDLMDKVLTYSTTYTDALTEEAKAITGGLNPYAIGQLKEWIQNNEGIEVPTLRKADVDELLSRTDIRDDTRRLLEIRQELGKTSVKKYDKTKAATCADGRIRGTLQFYGAGRTGRWAGRLLQVQNLPRNKFNDFDLARRLVKAEKWEELELLYDSMNDVFSTLIRTLIIPSEGMTFAVADYSAIEARVIAWMAGEKWRQDVFAKGGDIYCASASAMFGVPVEKHGRNAHLRKKGKIAELALGYGGGVGALKAMGGEALGLKENEMEDIVRKWRRASPHICRLWRSIGDAAYTAVNDRRKAQAVRGVTMEMQKGILFMGLPSGRKLAYYRPQYEGTELTYMGQNQTTRKWTRLKTWGGKLTENLIQATARDCLALTLQRIERAGYQTVMHVHDEVIVEVPRDEPEKHLQRIEAIMAEPIGWAPGLILTADGFTSDYYRKD